MLNWESRVFLIPNCEGRKQQSHGSMGNPPVPKERTSILAKRRTLEKPEFQRLSSESALLDGDGVFL